MQRTRELVVSDRISVAEALKTIESSDADALLVEVRYGQWRWVGKRELERAKDNGDEDSSLHKAMKMWPVVRTYPDLPLDQALRKLAIYPALPVTSRVNPSFLLGTLTLADVHRAYGITRQEPKAKAAASSVGPSSA